MIQSAPTGVPWDLIPMPGATLAQQLAEQANVAWRATAEVDRICNQPLRATLDVEEEVGPDFRVTVNPNNGVASMLASRWPVVAIIGGQVSSATSFPPAWTPIPATSLRTAGQLLGTYGTTAAGTGGAGPAQIDIAPGYVGWGGGRSGTRLQVAYINGWPHTSLTAPAVAGATQIQVDDVTGFAGAAAFAYDSGMTETVTATAVSAVAPTAVMGATVPVGPGTLTLAAPLAYPHSPGVVISALPWDVSWAAILLCAAQVLESGSTSVTIQNISGSQTAGGKGVEDLRVDAELILSNYHRVI